MWTRALMRSANIHGSVTKTICGLDKTQGTVFTAQMLIFGTLQSFKAVNNNITKKNN